MKTFVLGITLAALCGAADWHPAQADLDQAVVIAGSLWGVHADVVAISVVDLGGCWTAQDHYAVTWRDRGVIQINSRCHWNPTLLNLVVEHEYGHLLAFGASHSLDKHSVMFPHPQIGQRITKEDREQVSELLH